MFPGPGAQIYYNEAGEVLGWDYPPDPDNFYDDEMHYSPEDEETEDDEMHYSPENEEIEEELQDRPDYE